jgi:hypothetical protein
MSHRGQRPSSPLPDSSMTRRDVGREWEPHVQPGDAQDPEDVLAGTSDHEFEAVGRGALVLLDREVQPGRVDELQTGHVDDDALARSLEAV